jgi:hypothetical protein
MSVPKIWGIGEAGAKQEVDSYSKCEWYVPWYNEIMLDEEEHKSSSNEVNITTDGSIPQRHH